MIDKRVVLLLVAPDATPAARQALEVLREALRDAGVQVDLRSCAAPYDDVLDAVAAADTVVYWR